MILNRVNSAINRNERNKINENFDILERGYGKAFQDSQLAKDQSTYAVETSDEAKQQAESTQIQLDTIVIEGDSSVEAAQARVSVNDTVYTTLKERLDAENAQITQQLAQTDAKLRNKLSITEFAEYVTGDDWAPAINKAFGMWNDATSPYYQKKINIRFDTDASYNIKSTIFYNPKWVEIDGRGARLKTVGIGQNGFNIAFHINTGDQYGTTYNLHTLNYGLFIEGEGRTISNTIGVYMENVADIKMTALRVTGFESSLKFGNNAYLLSFLHCVFVGYYAVEHPSGIVNAGERLTFIDCSFGGEYAVYNNSINGSLHFIACSFDFLFKAIVKSNNGTTFMNSCHFELDNNTTETPFQVTGDSTLIVDGGWLLYTSSNAVLPYIVQGDGLSKFINVKAHNLKTTNGQFASDTGTHDLIIGNSVKSGNGLNWAKVQSSHNVMMDGSFEGSSIIDLIWVNVPSQTNTNRHTTVGMNVVLDTEYYNSGTKSIRINKTATNGSVYIAFPLERFDRARKHPLVQWYISKNNTVGTGGTIYNRFHWANLLITNQTQKPEIIRSQFVNDGATTFAPTLDKPWTKVTSNANLKIVYDPPSWATHVMLELNLNSYDGASNSAFLNLDDIHFEMV